MQGKVEICGVNTARLKTLTSSQMDALLKRAKAGDAEARQQLVEGNLRLVLSVIGRFEKRGESPDDLFQVGCIGLMKAIANFDPDKNVRFSTYGVPMIAGEIRRYLRDYSAIRVSRSLRDTKNTEGSRLEQIALREGFSRLGDREKQILHARFFDGQTQMDVAKSMHISQAQVSRLEKGAICELRKYVSVQVS